MAFDKLHWLPVIVFILFPGTFIITYIIAVCNDHVEAAFPYISDTGSLSPESCIFGQLINLGCVLLLFNIYIRYRQLRSIENFRWINRVSFGLGCLATFGLSIVGNFQESNVIIVHMIGAFLCFGVGTVYFWLQAVITFRMSPAECPSWLAWLRVFFALICTIFFIVTAVTGVAAQMAYHGEDITKWHPTDGGWEEHVASTASEWIVATSFCAYILTFSYDFKTISMIEPQFVVLKESLNPENCESSPAQASYTQPPPYSPHHSESVQQDVLHSPEVEPVIT